VNACPACGERLPDRPVLRGFDRLHGVPGEFEVLVCERCGTGRTLPDLPADQLGSLYPADYGAFAVPEGLAKSLSEVLFRWQYARAVRRAPLCALPRSGRLLDVGGGRGDLGVALRKRGWDVTGLEPSEEAASDARRRGVPTVRGTLGTSAAELEGPFDAVVFQHSLEHVAEPAVDLVAARELLRPDGLLLIWVPNFGSWASRRFGSAWFHLDLPRHRSHFTPQGLGSLLGRTGFESPRLATSTSADGLPTSLQYRAFGRRRFDRGVSRYLAFGAGMALVPVSLVTSVLGGGGDILHAVSTPA
jgi:SAM-dependent methyltransferase